MALPEAADTEESISALPEPASDSDRRPRAPTRITPPQRAEAETPRPDVAERPRQIAEGPPPRREPRAEPAPEEQYAERARAGYEYWVQIGSHKDEAASRAEWQRYQGAVSALSATVGNRIQRADLGARGVYYRLQLGPFASPGEAGQFCAQLKSRQVDCFLAPPEASTASTTPPEEPRKATPPAPKPVAKPKPAETKPIAKPAEPKPTAPAERPKDTATAPKPSAPELPPPLPEPKPPRSTAEKPDAPISTAPGLPGVLD